VGRVRTLFTRGSFEISKHPETEKPISADIGLYGPYVQYGDEYQSLGEYEDPDVYTITREEALEVVEENFD
jgi:topoisomerase IA-like protein